MAPEDEAPQAEADEEVQDLTDEGVEDLEASDSDGVTGGQVTEKLTLVHSGISPVRRTP